MSMHSACNEGMAQDRLFTGLPPVEEIERYSRPRSTRPQPPAISALTWAIATGHSHAFW